MAFTFFYTGVLATKACVLHLHCFHQFCNKVVKLAICVALLANFNRAEFSESGHPLMLWDCHQPESVDVSMVIWILRQTTGYNSFFVCKPIKHLINTICFKVDWEPESSPHLKSFSVLWLVNGYMNLFSVVAILWSIYWWMSGPRQHHAVLCLQEKPPNMPV